MSFSRCAAMGEGAGGERSRGVHYLPGVDLGIPFWRRQKRRAVNRGYCLATAHFSARIDGSRDFRNVKLESESRRKSVASEPLKKLLQDVNAGQLVLPQFQRDFVWQPSAVLKLLTSLFNGYPIGSLLLMENNRIYDFRLIDGVPTESKKDDQENVLILDGQQRLTACYRAFYGTLKAQKYPGRYYLNYTEFVRRKEAGEEVDGSALEDLFVFHRPQKVLKELSNTAEEHSAGLFPLDVIFSAPRGSNYADWMQRYNFTMSKGDEARFEKLSSVSSNFVSDFIEKVTSYQVNYEKITRDTKPDVICTVFETINTTGVKLTVFDLLVVV